MTKIFRQEANFIKLILTHDCAQPWFILINTFFPAFVKALFTIAIIDAEDLVRSHAQGLAGAKAGGRRGGIAHSKVVRQPMDVVPGERRVSQGLKTLLVFTAPLEFIGFWWLVYGASEQFFFDWASLLRERKYCSAQLNSGPLIRSSGPENGLFNQNGSTIGMEFAEQNRSSWESTAFGAGVPDGIYAIILTCTVEDELGNGLPDCGVRFRIQGASGTRFVEGDRAFIPHGHDVDLMCEATVILSSSTGNSIVWESFSPTHALAIAQIKDARVIITRRA